MRTCLTVHGFERRGRESSDLAFLGGQMIVISIVFAGIPRALTDHFETQGGIVAAKESVVEGARVRAACGLTESPCVYIYTRMNRSFVGWVRLHVQYNTIGNNTTTAAAHVVRTSIQFACKRRILGSSSSSSTFVGTTSTAPCIGRHVQGQDTFGKDIGADNHKGASVR